MTPDQSRLLGKSQASIAAAALLFEGGHPGFAASAAAALLFEGGHPGFAASRAYYAMFYAAEALLLGEGASFSKHAAVISAFGQRFGAEAVELHRFLIEGQESRTKGDYRADDLVTEEEAETQIARARKFLEFAEAYLSGVG